MKKDRHLGQKSSDVTPLKHSSSYLMFLFLITTISSVYRQNNKESGIVQWNWLLYFLVMYPIVLFE